MMPAEDPGIGGFSFRLAKNHRPAALERAAGVPLAVAAEALEGFVVGEDRLQRPLDQFLLRLGVRAGKSLFRAQRRSIICLAARRMSFGAVIVRQDQLALLIGGERRVEFADQ